MKTRKLVVLLANTRRIYPDPENDKSLLQADNYDPETIEWMIKHLENLGVEVIFIEADEKAYFKLAELKDRIALVYNDSEGVRGADREAQLPAMMEMLGIPYTTSSPLTQALVLNKAKTKEVLMSHNIATPAFTVINGDNLPDKIKPEFPLIVKPLAEGSSAGITNKSVVYNQQELDRQVKWIKEVFKEPVLVEKFLSGREFSVAMLGNPPEILPIIESDHSVLPKEYAPIDSLEVKWFFEEKSKVNNLTCPAKITKELEETIRKMCQDAWRALGIKDLCRIDIRCDENSNPFILEVNSPPGMIPPEVSTSSYFPLAAKVAGMDYEALLKRILTAAADRYGIKLFET